MKSLARIFLSVFLTILLGAGAALGQKSAELKAEDKVTQDIEIILDASGSMQGKIGGKTKISIAKQVLLEMVQNLRDREDIALAVRVYGHQFHKKHRNCTDSKLEIPFGPPDPALVASLNAKVKAQGYTPIALSLNKSKDDFDLKAKRKRTIILITDGLESCGGDPCRAAAALAKAGLEVVLHVVAFDLKKKQRAQLECLTKPGGGLLLAAQDAQQLNRALSQVIKKTLAENLVIRAVNSKGVKLEAGVIVYPAGAKKEVARRYSKRASFKLPAGSYDVLVRPGDLNQEKKLTNLSLSEEQKTEKEVVFPLARIGGMARNPAGEPIKASLRLDQMDEGKAKYVRTRESAKEPYFFSVTPGSYRLTITNSATKQKQVFDNIQVADGQEVLKEASFGKARIGGLAKNQAGKPIKAYVRLYRVLDGEAKYFAAGYSGKEPHYINVEPGSYRLEITSSATKQKQVFEDIQVTDGQEVLKEASFGKARIGGLAKNQAGKPIKANLRLDRMLDGQAKYVSAGHSGKDPFFFQVEPGAYRLTITVPSTHQNKVFEGIQLADGQEVLKEATFGKARLGGMVKDSAGKPVKGYIRIYRIDEVGDKKNVGNLSSGVKPAVFDVVPGTYDLVLRNQATGQEKRFSGIKLEDGQEVIKEASFGKAKLIGWTKDLTGKPIKGYVRIWRIDEVGDRKNVGNRSCGAKPAEFEVIPGTYEMSLRNQATKQEHIIKDIKLGDGQEVVKEAKFGQAKLGAGLKDGSGKFFKSRIIVFRIEADNYKKQVANGRSGGAPKMFEVAPGLYEIHLYDNATKKTHKVTDIKIEHGQVVIKEVVVKGE